MAIKERTYQESEGKVKKKAGRINGGNNTSTWELERGKGNLHPPGRGVHSTSSGVGGG